MKREERVDQHGFPIPPGFEDQPGTEPRRRPPSRRARWVVLALLVAVIASLIVESPVSTTARRWAASCCWNRAQDDLSRGNLPGAISKLGWAIFLVPDAPRLYAIRASWRLAAGDLEGSLEDFSRAIELNPSDAQLYSSRSQVYQRLDRTADALRDLNQAVKQSDPNDPAPLNNRAYARAVAGVELKEGMADIEKAIQLEGKGKDKENGEYIDTRGWLRFRMGDYKGALADLDLAIKLTHSARQHDIDILAGRLSPRRLIEQCEQRYGLALAVMHHHRGEIYEKLGDKKQAATDLKLGEKLGYDPKNGVF